MTDLVTVENLGVVLDVGGSARSVLRDVSLTIGPGEALGLVGESGSGKSMTARAIARLLPRGVVTSGTVRVAGRDVLQLRGEELRRQRTEVAMIFQDPRAHINPVRRIGDFLTERLRTLDGLGRDEANRRAQMTLSEVGITDTARRLRQYPDDLSGGMLQRVMIAAALLSKPRLILADEPTTALDVTTQSEVMAILDEMRRDTGVALLFITHDLDLAAAVCDRTAVMYAGEIIEMQPSSDLHERPRHPYTAALAAARPDLDHPRRRLAAIPGRPVSAWEAHPICAFSTRCGHLRPECLAAEAIPLRRAAGYDIRCERAGELEPLLRSSHG